MEEAIVSCVVERLGDLLINEAKFLWGVKGQIENVQSKLQCMSAFLQDADAFVRNGDERVRLLVVIVRDTSYDLEDVIETYVFKVALKKKGGVVSKLKRYVCIFKEGVDVHRVGSKIKEISSNIDALTSELQKYGVHESMVMAAGTSSNQVREQRRRAYSYVVENHVVGFEKDTKELVDLLTGKENPQNPRVISVCGMGGLGKTTLARKVYHHPQVRSHFDCFAWVSISQQCNRRNAWEEILLAFTSPTKERREEIKILSDGELTEELYNFQKEKKCLVLLDDIWSTDTWDLLKDAFPRGDIDSKILLTTRKMNIGPYVDQHCYIHQPMCLDENQSWELFQKKSSYFGRDQTSIKDAERMEALGREMLKDCSGLPLAIILLGGLLSTKHTVNEWEEIKGNVMRYITKGREHDDSKYSGVSSVLGLSYDELPFYLKPCFLYLARYPEDATIQVKELCLMLVAEGFIPSRGASTVSIEDVAYNCLSELVERSMIQVEEWGLTRKMKSFRIHDLMRDMCLSKAQDKNFLQFIDLRNRGEEPLKSVSTDIRRVAIYFDSVDDFLPFVDNINGALRCLIIELVKPKKVLRPVINSFLMLRVLKLRASKGRFEHPLKLPKEIGKLIHLRLFSTTYVENIPSSIGNLRCLQTLLVKSDKFDDNVKVPNVMWKLEQLRHLSLPYYYSIPAFSKWLRLPNLRNLQTLTHVQMKYLDRNDFLQLTNLKKLAIKVDRNLERIFQDPTTVTFVRLRHLQIRCLEEEERVDIVPMILSYPQIYKLKVEGGIVKLPEYNQFSPNLVKLKLEVTCLKDDPMPTLEKPSSLRDLSLCVDSFVGNEMVCSKGGFPQLESLQISFLCNLEEWKVEEGSLSSLRILRIVSCKKLKRVPEGLRYVTTLKEMKIQTMPREFKERLEEGGEDFYKVHHIPSRIFLKCDK